MASERSTRGSRTTARPIARRAGREPRLPRLSSVAADVKPCPGDRQRALGEGGRLAIIGFARGEIARLPANQVLLRNRAVIGVDWGAWAMQHPEDQRVLLREALDMVDRGALAPPEPTTYPLERAGDALADLLEHRLVGKAVLRP